jgi:hypothetical protein
MNLAIDSQRLYLDPMQKIPNWQGLPYYPISLFYKEKFGAKVYKIPVSIAETCPNREGLNGMKTCNFCDVWGSAAYPEVREKALREQIELNRDKIRRRFNANQFLVYFQAYTNTFSKVTRLREQFEVASSYEDIKGFVVGTRPDCVSEAVLKLWNEYSEKFFVAVELGVQSFNEDQLIWMRRGHTAQKSLWAIDKIKAQCPEVDLGIHLMFGLPGETDEQIVETAKLCSRLPIDNVKLHNLHVLKHTPLADDYKKGLFEPISREQYVDRVILFLQHLDSRIAVHRVAAVASRHEELVAPRWTASKLESYQYVLDEFQRRKAYQGQQLT